MTKSKHFTLSRGQRWAIGKNCFFELLQNSPERIIKAYAAKPLDRSSFPVEIVRRDELTQLVGTDSHQGYAAVVKERESMQLSDLIEKTKEKKRSLVLAIDSVQDPQNLGAILRAAECFGVDAVLWSKNRGVDVTPVVTKASVGATELVNIVKVSNLVEAVKKLKEADYWAVAAELGKDSVPVEDFDPPERCVLIVGSEGEGIRQLLSRQADAHVYIPMKGRIDSLNVSQATSLLLYLFS